jgi:hypothetical protein
MLCLWDIHELRAVVPRYGLRGILTSYYPDDPDKPASIRSQHRRQRIRSSDLSVHG